MNETALEMFIEKLNSIGSFFGIFHVIWYTVLPPICSITGVSMKDILRSFNFGKNKRCSQRIIVNKMRDESFSDILKKILFFAMGMSMLMINMYIIFEVIQIFLLFANIRIGNVNNKDAAILLGVMLMGVVFAGALTRLQGYSALCGWAKCILLFICASVFTILLTTLFARGLKIYSSVLMLVSIFLTNVIVFLFYRCKIYRSYHKYTMVKIVRMIQYIMLMGYTVIFFVETKVSENNMYFWMWTALSCIEYIYIGRKDKINVNVILHTWNGEKVTRDKIVKYGENKIGYTLLSGKEEIIDEEEIAQITYQRKCFRNKYNRQKKRVECKLRSGEILYYNDYQLICDSWVGFLRIEGEMIDVLITKLKNTESIMSWRITKSNEKYNII